MSATVRDDTYYCPDLVIKIESVLFRVPRVLFEQSETFSDMFQIPPPHGAVVDGSDDEHPLVLEGYLAHEFRALLQVLFPLKHAAIESLDLGHWISVLKLATVWGFAAIRVTALGKLWLWTESDPVLKVVLSQKYNVQEWFVPGLNALARRDEPLSTEDMRRFEDLGDAAYVLDIALKIGRVRESFVGQYNLPTLTFNFGAPPAAPAGFGFGGFAPPADAAAKPCFGHHKCECHGVSTQCAAASAAPRGRVAHDFTPVIHEVFQCAAPRPALAPLEVIQSDDDL